MSKKIDFVISNPNHHLENFLPVIDLLISVGNSVRIISLCEFRRMDTPIYLLKSKGIPYEILSSLKNKNTSTSTGKKYIGGNNSLIRNLLRGIIWYLKLKPAIIKSKIFSSDLIIIPNDIAYPIDRILFSLKKQNKKTILFQEGIRFPIPNEKTGKKYGTNGANFLFCWGNYSANYFESIGVDHDTLKIIGNPRFDKMMEISKAVVSDDFNLLFNDNFTNLLYASNPVDDQGFCSLEEKIKLFERFVHILSHSTDDFDKPLKIWLRLHPREDEKDFYEIIKNFENKISIVFLNDYPLFSCLRKMDACFILASTVGLEAVLNNTPLGIIKLPNYGYVFDYIEMGVGRPINLENESEFISELNSLLTPLQSRDKNYKDYIENHIANIGKSNRIFYDEILNVLSDKLL